MSFSEQNHCITVLLIAIVIGGALPVRSQPSQPARFEVVQNESDQPFTTVSLGSNGIALIREQRISDGKRNWELIQLDSALQQIWTTQIPLEPNVHLIGFEYNNGELFFLFRFSESNYNDLHLVRIYLFTRTIQHISISPKLDFKLTHFIVAGNSCVLAGYVSKQPAVLLHDMASDHLKILPGFFIENTELLDIKSNKNGTFNALLVERGSGEKKKLLLKTFDEGGSLLVEDDIETDPKKVILAGTTSALTHDDLLIAGIWGTGSNSTKQASGIFSVLADPYTQQTITYTDFGELDHILDYLPPKRISKIKSQEEHRRHDSKSPSFRINAHLVKMEDTAEGFALLCELYIPTINTSFSNSNPYGSTNPYYSPMGGMYGGSMYTTPYYWNPMMMNRYYNSPYDPYGASGRNSDVTMLNSAIILFDNHGKVKEDLSLPLEELKLPSLEQITDFYATNKVVQFYKREQEIHLVTVWEGGDEPEKDTLKIQTKSSLDIVRKEQDDQGGARYWYDRYGYVWGYETIRNRVEKPNDPVRYVYYINKIKLD